MKFKEKVQTQFELAGWHEGRNIKNEFDLYTRLDEFPVFLKEFLYEYGDLIVNTFILTEGGSVGTLDFSAKYNLDDFLDKNRGYGLDLKTFPIAYYDLDNSSLECDEDGNVYLSGDFPVKLADNFKEGIEKAITQNYNDVLYWDEFNNEWTTRKFIDYL